MKKILFITSRLPYPTTSGRKQSLYHYCRILNQTFGSQVTVLSFFEKEDRLDPKPNFINKVIKLEKPSKKEILKNLMIKTLLKKEFPIQVSLYYSEKTKKTIKEIYDSVKPDIVIADMVRTTEYCKEFPTFKIADLDDLISIRYQRQIDYGTNNNPYGAFLYSLPVLFQKFLNIKIIKNSVLRIECKLLYKYERNIYAKYDRTILVANQEVELINDELNDNKAIAIPIGVDIDYFGKYINVLKKKENTIVFLGAMNVSHNESGVIHFINRIFPQIIEKNPKVKLIVVGGGVTENLKKMSSENIIFTGRVDDVRKIIGECEVFICPLTFGSGIKTKNLEAMAMGIPIVTSMIGAENIDAKDKKEWLIAEDDNDFAEKVLLLLEKEELREELKRNAYEYVRNNFTWNIAEKEFMRLLEEI